MLEQLKGQIIMNNQENRQHWVQDTERKQKSNKNKNTHNQKDEQHVAHLKCMDICARKEQVVLISYKTFVVLLIVKF
jgi:lipopolysaccharide/colanic/teichoic acid biosynthesis glycosyltransferase